MPRARVGVFFRFNQAWACKKSRAIPNFLPVNAISGQKQKRSGFSEEESFANRQTAASYRAAKCRKASTQGILVG